MTDWVRVRDKDTKHEYTVAVVDPEAHEVLKDKDAVDSAGNPLPAKPHLAKGESVVDAPAPIEWKRVRDKDTKHEYSVETVDPEAHELLKEDAVDEYGAPLPGKPYVRKGQSTESAASKAGASDTERSAS